MVNEKITMKIIEYGVKYDYLDYKYSKRGTITEL